jgi:hypothetical protein
MLRRIFLQWRRLHNEELYALYSSPDSIKKNEIKKNNIKVNLQDVRGGMNWPRIKTGDGRLSHRKRKIYR